MLGREGAAASGDGERRERIINRGKKEEFKEEDEKKRKS